VAEWPGETPKSVLELEPSQFDQVLFQLGNEINHAFMARMVRHIGGTVMQHDWVLFDLALATYPGLVRGGWKGHMLALREGGFEVAKRYFQVWLDRRRERSSPAVLPDCHGRLGQLLAGWHDREPAGRWIADRALFRIPATGVTRVEVGLGSEPGRKLSLIAEAGPRADFVCTKSARGTQLAVDLAGLDEPALELGVSGIVVSAEQRSHGDCRRLGAFVEEVAWVDADGRHALDLSLPAAFPIRPVDLSRDRFLMPLNRSIVDHADAFIVHSDYVGDRIRKRRGAAIPIGQLPHGAAHRWDPVEPPGDRTARRAKRKELDLPASWADGFVVISFGGVQRHKRVGRVLAGLAKARETRDDIFLVMAGGWHAGDIDPEGLARMHGVEDAVHFTGYVPEEEAWDWIAAGDISINLRGPTSGGTSGGIYQSLAFGRAVIATDAAEQAELPDDCVPKVPLGEGEVDAIAALLVDLSVNSERHAALETAARRYVEDQCGWETVGASYARHLASFPAPRPGAQRVAAMRHELEQFFRSAED
jgi:glycosyltransferase involved in cell wall biosynthesis